MFKAIQKIREWVQIQILQEVLPNNPNQSRKLSSDFNRILSLQDHFLRLLRKEQPKMVLSFLPLPKARFRHKVLRFLHSLLISLSLNRTTSPAKKLNKNYKLTNSVKLSDSVEGGVFKSDNKK